MRKGEQAGEEGKEKERQGAVRGRPGPGARLRRRGEARGARAPRAHDRAGRRCGWLMVGWMDREGKGGPNSSDRENKVDEGIREDPDVGFGKWRREGEGWDGLPRY